MEGRCRGTSRRTSARHPTAHEGNMIMDSGKESPDLGTNVVGFCTRVKARTARVGVIGLGYVGLPLALLSVKGGFQTTGFDIDPQKTEKLQQGRSYIQHISGASVSEA